MDRSMYFSVSKDGLVYESPKLSDLPKGEAILCYLKRIDESVEEYKTQNGYLYRWYRYEFIDAYGKPTQFHIGNSLVTFIEHDKGSYYLNYRRFTIRDQYGHEGMFGTVGQKGNFEYPYFETIATSLVPFMLKLNSYGGWDAYMHHIYPNHPNANRMIWDDREY